MTSAIVKYNPSGQYPTLENSVRLKTDYLFDTKIVWGWLTGTYKESFVRATGTIYRELNYNCNKINVIGITECYSLENIYNVFNAYGNLLIEYSELAEYDGQKGDNDESNINTVQAVAIASSVSTELAGKVLKQLYWSTEQGRVDTSAWIKPRTYMKTEGLRELRKDATGSEWLNKLFWLLGLIAVAVAGFYAFKMYATYKATKFIGTGKL